MVTEVALVVMGIALELMGVALIGFGVTLVVKRVVLVMMGTMYQFFFLLFLKLRLKKFYSKIIHYAWFTDH